MANRAYLYVSNGEGEGNFRLIDTPPESWYYDSRHNLPPVWLFFFAPEDVRLVPVQNWYEILFISSRSAAVERFHRREPLLRTLLPPSVAWEWVEGMARDIAQTEGCNLILDPDEVLSEDESIVASRFRAFLAALDQPPPPTVEFWHSLYWVSGNAEEMRMRMLGTTYAGRVGSDHGFPNGHPTGD